MCVKTQIRHLFNFKGNQSPLKIEKIVPKRVWQSPTLHWDKEINGIITKSSTMIFDIIIFAQNVIFRHFCPLKKTSYCLKSQNRSKTLILRFLTPQPGQWMISMNNFIIFIIVSHYEDFSCKTMWSWKWPFSIFYKKTEKR